MSVTIPPLDVEKMTREFTEYAKERGIDLDALLRDAGEAFLSDTTTTPELTEADLAELR